ncbi:unnamed protein product [Leptidea sinapis]|uniref:Uncharacterized protein n=1 Tax=Leptidea sinapis TaxID=189913 RepID=A0A5E4QUG8_9NEOP|nr:unnamed protein product [Leptidea sinapis]
MSDEEGDMTCLKNYYYSVNNWNVAAFHLEDYDFTYAHWFFRNLLTPGILFSYPECCCNAFKINTFNYEDNLITDIIKSKININ